MKSKNVRAWGAALVLAGLVLAMSDRPLWAQLTETDLTKEPAPAAVEPSPDEAAWQAVLGLGGAKFTDKQSVAALLGPLPTEDELKTAGSFTPSAFMALHDQASAPVREAMAVQVRARLRELDRREALKAGGVDALLGREGDGVAGSKLYEIPPIPAESFTALVTYLELSAAMVSGGSWRADPGLHRKVEDQLRVSLAVSSADGRRQYRDFDVVFALVRREMALTTEAERRALLPGLVWLYGQVRGPAGLSLLPEVPAGLKEAAAAEGGAWFSRARQESESMPSSLAALTIWPAEVPVER